MRAATTDTIAAVATPAGEGGIGLLRLSGPRAVEIADRLFRAKDGGRVADQPSHTARYGHVIAGDGRIVDEAVLLLMRAPRSYTREDTVELGVHAGAAPLSAVLARLLEEGARPAEPGEFTKRAYLNGRIDLVQAEAVLDLIRARTDRAARWASAQLEGVLSRRLLEIKAALLEAAAHLEAAVDFPEDGIDADADGQVAGSLERALRIARDLLASAGVGLLAKNGASVAIVGRPNVGKSSLLNRLVGRDRAIVTPIAGTTRDTIEADYQVRGLPVRILDTAGIHATDHLIEREGVERARQALIAADLVLYVVDASIPLADQERRMLWPDLAGRPVVLAANKSDLGVRIDMRSVVGELAALQGVSCSCLSGEGFEALEEALYRALAGDIDRSDEAVVSSVRQRDLLRGLCADLDRAMTARAAKVSPELVAADVRLALQDLAEIVGEITHDELLDKLFGQFCIGK
ncbi:MAG: tRNA modification GTPase MnmE [Candidatus Omnitrophica bacterium]|nr:tRNA modification GTPase MnmE [Candidatus Omnitrophota bacterium]